GARALNGFVAQPDRTITPDLGASTVVTTFGIAIDATHDILYVGLSLNGATNIVAFSNASTANTTTTPLTPSRTLNFTLGLGSFFLDAAHDRLYASQFDGKVLVFDNASGIASGTPTPDRTIDLTGGLATIQFYIFVDTSRDKMYAVGNEASGTAGDLLIIDHASTATDVPPGGPQASDGVGIQVTTTNIRLSAVAVKP